MRSIHFSRFMVFGAMLCGFLFSVSRINAQVISPYRLENHHPTCAVTIQYEFFDLDAFGNCTVLCDVGTITVPPGPPTWLPVGGSCVAGSTCNVRITVLDIGGTPIIPAPSAEANGPLGPHNHAPMPAGCGPSPMFHFNVHFDHFNVHP